MVAGVRVVAYTCWLAVDRCVAAALCWCDVTGVYLEFLTLLKHVRVVVGLMIVLGSALQVGCIAGRTFVLERPAPSTVYTGVALRPMGEQIEVDPAVRLEFHEILTRKLTKELGVVPDDTGDLLLQYRITLFDEGEGAVRVGSTLTNFVGSPFYGLGDGAVGIEVRFVRRDGVTLGHIVTDGSISGAFGSSSSALEDAAGSIVKYVKMHYRCSTCGEGDGQLAK